jgi:predicted negative regulator of RcsB-dependent stress response
MDTQAYVLFKLERHEEALTWILMAQDNGMENDPVALEHEGDIRWAMGDQAGARKAFRQALDAGGDESVLTPKLNRP